MRFSCVIANGNEKDLWFSFFHVENLYDFLCKRSETISNSYFLIPHSSLFFAACIISAHSMRFLKISQPSL